MKNKKITFLINSLATGGAEKVLTTVANKLAKEFRVEIILLEKNDFYELDKSIKKTYLTEFSGKENPLLKLVYLPILAFKLKKYLKKNNISLLQSHVFRAHYINLLAKLFGSKHRAQIVISGIITFYKNEGLLGKINLFFIKTLFPKADLIVWKSKGMKLDAERIIKLKNKQVTRSQM